MHGTYINTPHQSRVMDPSVVFFFYYAAPFLLTALIVLLFFSSSNTKYPPSGPLALPLIGHLHLFRQPVHRSLAAIAARHGPLLLLRFGSRPVLLASSPAAAKEILSTHDAIFANRPIILAGKYLAYEFSILGATSNGPRWRSLRRLASLELLSSTRLVALSPLRSQEVRLLLRGLLRRHSGEEEKFQLVDVRSRVSETTFNMVTMVVEGRRYYGGEEAGAVAAGKEKIRFRRIVEGVFRMIGELYPGDFVPAWRWLGLGKGMKRRMESLGKEMDELFQEMVDERRRVGRWSSSGSDSEDQERNMIDSILKLQESEPEFYDDVLIKGIILNMILAGTDTTTKTMEWAMALLLNHPQALEKARSEIDMHVGCDRLLTDSDLPKLQYLHNIINETLRLYPVAPVLIPHESSEDCVVGGYHVPRGTMAFINAYAIQRDPEHWSRPQEFKPERFDGAEGDQEGFKNIPFGFGRRRCPGEGLAMRMMALTLGALIQCFEWKRIEDEEIDMTEGISFTMPMARPLEAMYKPRQTMIDVLSQL